MNKYPSLSSEIHKRNLDKVAGSIAQIVRIVRLQVEILDKIGFTDVNLDKVLNNLTPEQKESFNKIREDVGLHEHSKPCKKLNPNIIKTFNNKNLIQV